MLPLIPFIAGLAAGVATTELWRRGKVQNVAHTAGEKLRATGTRLRDNAASGLDSVRQTGAVWRDNVTEALHDKWARMRSEREGKTPRPHAAGTDDVSDVAEKTQAPKASASAGRSRRAGAKTAAKTTVKTTAKKAVKTTTKTAAKRAVSKTAAPKTAASKKRPSGRQAAAKKAAAHTPANPAAPAADATPKAAE